MSAQALREELARTADATGLAKITPHALRHTYATALVNAGVSLQALMQLLGHVSAAMSLRYGRLFDTTVRDEYERALTQAKAALAAGTAAPRRPSSTGEPGAPPLPLVDITGGATGSDTPTIKSRLAGGFCLRAPPRDPAPMPTSASTARTSAPTPASSPCSAPNAPTPPRSPQTPNARGWADEADRHRRLADRLDQLITHAGTE